MFWKYYFTVSRRLKGNFLLKNYIFKYVYPYNFLSFYFFKR